MEEVAKIQVMKKHVNKFLKNTLNNVLLGITSINKCWKFWHSNDAVLCQQIENFVCLIEKRGLE